MPRSGGTWEKGQSGNPGGRPKTDKGIAIKIILRMMAKHGDKFEAELEKLANKDILKFYNDYVAPVQPKDIKLVGDEDEPIIIKWQK
ncbi:MAG TPA: hypothetical protein ENK81_02735 [Euryarchaeota archaeon]|nr:hypothetical protein [Euryarchaeota archaeon]